MNAVSPKKNKRAVSPEKHKIRAKKGTIKKIFRYVGKYPIALVLTLLLAVVTVALTLYVPILIGDAIDCIIGEGNVNFSALKTIFLKIGISVAITAAAQWIMSALNNRITYQVVRDLRSDAFSKISSLPLKYLDSHPTERRSAALSRTRISSRTGF